MIYFDNAATTRKKPKYVLWHTFKSLISPANPSRGGHKASLKAGQNLFEVRSSLNRFFHGYGEANCIFTSGCTEALNLAILGTAKPGGHIIASHFEHNSVLRPLEHLKKTHNITVTLTEPSPEAIARAITPNTYLVCINHTSNVTGQTAPVEEIGKLAHSRNLSFLVDAAQSAGHEKIDMQKQNIDFLAVAGHKGMLGIMGAGALLTSGRIPIAPIKFGGTGTHSTNLSQPALSPEGFESGTPPYHAIIALGAGAAYISKNNQKIKSQTKQLANYLFNQLQKTEGITLYTKMPSTVLSFAVKDKSSEDVADLLNTQYHICVRAGLHCAPMAHTYLGTIQTGLVRVSISSFNTLRQCKQLVSAIKQITQKNS